LPLVPVTVKFRGLLVLPERPLTVIVVLWPGVMLEGLKEQVVPLAQLKLIWPLKEESSAEAAMVSVVEVVPIIGVLDGPEEESEKSATASPFRLTTGGVFSLSVRLRAPLLLSVVELLELEVLVVCVGL